MTALGFLMAVSESQFTLDDNDVIHHGRTITLLTMQPISDDIKNYADNIKNVCRCCQVRTDPIICNTFLCYRYKQCT